MQGLVLPVLAISVVLFDGGILAQQSGNNIEIFGKERIQNTREGSVVHQFAEGLALRDAIKSGLLTGGQDIIYWQIATGKFSTPYNQKELTSNYIHDSIPLIWAVTHADTLGVFSDRLQKGYLFTWFESPVNTIALLEATGHTRTFINGMPHEGDQYDSAPTLIPFQLRQGVNEFIYTSGKFGKVAAKIIIPRKEIQFTDRDMTLPSVIRGERADKWGALRLINASEKQLTGLTIRCVLETGETLTYPADPVIPMTVRKVKFKIPQPLRTIRGDKISASVFLEDHAGNLIDQITIQLNIYNERQIHERTFISNIDGSVQYYSVVPSSNYSQGQALILSLHGESVEATNQARAYKPKDWAHIVTPTNRRPFGFNWEEWGRLDAMEVLDDFRRLFPTDTARTYLTGHCMGGHGTWFLGATYPGLWAAIAPAAGYPDITNYRHSGVDTLFTHNPHYKTIYRSALAGRTLDLVANFVQSGIYVLHGDADLVVPVDQSRMMRNQLGAFHSNFSYYEYPGGTHWYGDPTIDHPPLFDFLRYNSIPPAANINHIDFTTTSPGVSSTNYWIGINQQLSQYRHSRVRAIYQNDTIRINTTNVAHFTLFNSLLQPSVVPVVFIDNQRFALFAAGDVHFRRQNGRWSLSGMLHLMEKHPGRYGGFKLAFTNNMMFVYATAGTPEENQWYENKARFDAETFLHRANGSIDIIPDTLFSTNRYLERNVIIYGNAENNLAWSKLLENSPVQVYKNGIDFDGRFFESSRMGTFFIYPRGDSQTALVGVVAGTGTEGMKATYSNDYFSGITGFPDLLIFDVDWIRDGPDGLLISGFFGNDWGVRSGDFVVVPNTSAGNGNHSD